MKQKSFSISKLYYYVVAFISLFVVLFNVQAAASSSLRFYVFKTPPAFQWQPPFPPFMDSQYRYYPAEPAMKEQATEALKVGETLKENQSLTQDQKEQVEIWLSDFKLWKEQQENYKTQFTDQLIQELVSVLIFTPVFLFHFINARRSK